MVFDRIKDIVVEQMGVEPEKITMDTMIYNDLEADSLELVDVIVAIEEEFEIEIPDEVSEKFKSISDIVTYIESVTK